MSCRQRISVPIGIIVVCLACAPLTARADSHGKRPVTFGDLKNFKEGFGLKLSPDGKALAYFIGEGGENSVYGGIWIVSTQSGQQPHRIATGLLPLWSPDGEHLAYYANDKKKDLQLWVLDLATGQARQLTSFPKGIDPDPVTYMAGWIFDALRYSWSPDSAQLVFCSRTIAKRATKDISTGTISLPRQKPGNPLTLTPKTPKEWTMSGVFVHASGGLSQGVERWKNGFPVLINATAGQPPEVNQLFTVDITTKKVKELTADDAWYFSPDWSPDGKSIICASYEGRPVVGYGPDISNIYAIDVEKGARRAVTSGLGAKTMPTWSPDGQFIAYRLHRGTLFGERSVVIVRPTGADAVDVTDRLDRSVDDFEWSPGSKSIVVNYQDGVISRLAQIEVQTGKTALLVSGEDAGRRDLLTVSRSGTAAWEQSDPSSPAVLEVLPPGAPASIPLVEINPQVKEWILGQQEIVTWRNQRGDEMEGVLIKPLGYQTSHHYPLIVDAYPGQMDGFKADPMMANQAWAAKGYAVFWPNPRSPHTWENPFKSAAFDQAGKGPEGWDVAVDDVLSGVDELIARGIVDGDRMCLYGFSNGSAVVNYLVTRTNRFKCAVSASPAMTDWIRPSLLDTGAAVAPFDGGVTVWDDPEAYVRLSAVFFLNKVKTPMLLAVGDEDPALLDSIEMYNGLRQFGQDVTFLRYPKQGHGLTGAALDDFIQRVDNFFDNHLRRDSVTVN